MYPSTTVSRVLNKVPTVNKEIARKVERAIAELRFTPNPTAQRLAKGVQNTAVGFVIPGYPGIFHSFYAVELMRGIGHWLRNPEVGLDFPHNRWEQSFKVEFCRRVLFSRISLKICLR